MHNFVLFDKTININESFALNLYIIVELRVPTFMVKIKPRVWVQCESQSWRLEVEDIAGNKATREFICRKNGFPTEMKLQW